MDNAGDGFPAWLGLTMRARGISQAQLARSMGVGETQVSRWRRGLAIPTVHSLQRLAETFGVPRATLDQLAGYPIGGATLSLEVNANESDSELAAYQAMLAELMEQRVPRELWHVYVEGCSALAEALSRTFNGTLERAESEDAARESRSSEPLGFREPNRHDRHQSGEFHGYSDRH
ncbi:MAG: helix-turn-helix domain-containing protein [Nitrolancea sp.]